MAKDVVASILWLDKSKATVIPAAGYSLDFAIPATATSAIIAPRGAAAGAAPVIITPVIVVIAHGGFSRFDLEMCELPFYTILPHCMRLPAGPAS